MNKKTKRLIKERVATALAYITIGLMILAGLAIAYLALDFLGLIAWVASGQVPEGGFNTGFYFGRVWYLILGL